jgi:hypothetical protein
MGIDSKRALRVLFGFIFASLTAYNLWASTQQPLWEWGGLTRAPDRYWTIAAFIDAYYGFITFYVWVAYKELRWSARVGWFLAIMLLGNVAVSAYVLLQLHRLAPDAPAAATLTARNA